MKIKNLYYLSLARSFSSKLPGVKISAIITEFSKICNVELVAGRDFVFWKKNKPLYGNGTYVSDSKTSSYLKISISEFLDILHDFILFFYLLKTVRSGSIVWERSNRLHFSGLIISKIKKSKYVLEWKDNLVLSNNSFFRQIALIVEKFKVRYADEIVVESLILKKMLLESTNISESKIHVAYNSVNPNLFNSKLNQFCNNNPIIVGYSGSFAFYHNMKLFSDLILFKKWEGVKFLFIGSGGNKNQIQNELGNDDKSNIIEFLDPVSSEYMPQIYSRFDIAILPGATDIIAPIKIVEYLSCGTVLIAPDEKSIKEQFENFPVIQYFSSKNLESFISTLENTIINLDSLKKLTASYSDEIRETFSWENTWGQVLKLIIKKK